MSEELTKVRVLECSDRYILVDEFGDVWPQGDTVGFSYAFAAKEYARQNGAEVVQ